MPPNVHYYGSEKYELLPGWLAAMDVGLCLYRPGPADYSSPLKVFDYLSSGLAVVATEQPQTREIFAQLGQEDLLMPYDDPRRLAAALSELSRDRERARRLGAAGRRLLIEKYTWRRAIAETFAAIETLRAERRSAGHRAGAAAAPAPTAAVGGVTRQAPVTR
jgi:glycosyltransferase involved in cell wall biosynthesis